MINIIPKTKKMTLRRIIENLSKIPTKGFDNDTPKLSTDQKRKLIEMASQFESYGECIKNEECIVNSAKGLTELCELAEQYAINECGDWFAQDIVKKDMNELKKRVGEYNKIAKESYARMQQLGVAYQDIGHILGRYYDLKGTKALDQTYQEPSGQGEKQPLQMEKKDKSKKTDLDKQSQKVDKTFAKMEKDPSYRPSPFNK